MNQKTLFFISLNWTFYTFSSELPRSASEPIKIVEATWFLNIKATQNVDLIISCALAHQTARLLGALDFEQTECGTLYATNIDNKLLRQKLGEFPEQTIHTHKYEIEWYVEQKSVTIKFPYSNIKKR